MYNVNDLGYYNGGVPRKNRGAIRGEALMQPGLFHSPQIHNFMHYDHPDSKRVTSEEALMFNHFMTTDKADFNRSYPAYPMFYDKDFDYTKDRAYWLRVLLGLYLGTYVYRKMHCEYRRYRQNQRIEGFPTIPAHHFNNRGGVLVLKQFTGFEKYFQNGENQMNWYYKVYPRQMTGHEQ